MTVFGIFPDCGRMDHVLGTLRNAGFRSSDVSVLFSNKTVRSASAAAPESSGFEESAFGWLSGIGALSIPGSGPFIAAGPIMGLLGGIGLQGESMDLVPGLMSLGVPEYEARSCERRMRAGAVLVSVHCQSEEWERRARSVLEEHAAEDVSGGGD